MARKTKKMLAVEGTHFGGQPIERFLPKLITAQGLSATAEQLGISKATLGYWVLKLGINVRRIALGPGEELQIRRLDDLDISPFLVSAPPQIREVSQGRAAG